MRARVREGDRDDRRPTHSDTTFRAGHKQPPHIQDHQGPQLQMRRDDLNSVCAPTDSHSPRMRMARSPQHFDGQSASPPKDPQLTQPSAIRAAIACQLKRQGLRFVYRWVPAWARRACVSVGPRPVRSILLVTARRAHASASPNLPIFRTMRSSGTVRRSRIRAQLKGFGPSFPGERVGKPGSKMAEHVPRLAPCLRLRLRCPVRT